MQLGDRFRGRLPADARPLEASLIQLHDREQAARARGAAGRGETGARREQHAIVAEGIARWTLFAEAIERAKRRGLRNMREEEVSEFVARYRELTTDFARLKTATGGRDSDALYYVSRLVAGGHNLLYRRREIPLRAVWHFFAVAVPTEVRRSWRPILAAAVLLFGPAAAAYVSVVRDPAVAEEILSAEMIDRAESATARARSGQGFVPLRESPVLASFIIQNNVKVSIAAFAFGVTAGVGTLLLLVFNGVQLGAPLALFASKGASAVIWGWIAAHGELELAAICVAAGGGLLLASAILLPGARTRREALVVQGRRAVRLITASTLMLVVAGTLEGLVSPRSWPVEMKLALGVAAVLAFLAYFALGRGEDGEGEENAYTDRDSRHATRGTGPTPVTPAVRSPDGAQLIAESGTTG